MGGMGVFFPFCGLYLRQDLGFSATQVGTLLAAVPLAGLLAQPLWGQLADRTGSHRVVLTLVSLGAALAALALCQQQGFPRVLSGLVAFAVFHTALIPMATAATLAQVGIASFGLFRMWGTVGFLVLVVSFPWVSELSGHGGSLALLFPVVALLYLAAAAWALVSPKSKTPKPQSRKGDVRRLLSHGPVVRLLAVSFVINLFIQGPIYLFPLYLSSRGGDASTVSRMWILMLVLEIPLIAFSSRIFRQLGPRGLLTLGLTTEAIRWTLCAMTTDLRIIAAAQVLHGVGVAGILVGAPLYLEHVAPVGLRSTAQALVSVAGMGGGAIVSNALAGWLMDQGSVEAPYALAGAGTLVLALSLRWLLPEPHRPAVA